MKMATASLILTLLLLFITTLPYTALSTEEEYEYDDTMIDDFQSLNPRSGSRFLASKTKKAPKCNSKKENICPVPKEKNNTTLLSCCKTHCRNVLRDKNNCGKCGSKCKFGQLCCNGICTSVGYDKNNCGKCAKVCKSGIKCEMGVCGYA